jgi:hypothetical protein
MRERARIVRVMGVDGELVAVEPIETLPAAEPHESLPVLHCSGDESVGQPFFDADPLEAHVLADGAPSRKGQKENYDSQESAEEGNEPPPVSQGRALTECASVGASVPGEKSWPFVNHVGLYEQGPFHA